MGKTIETPEKKAAREFARAWGAYWALGDAGRWGMALLLTREGALTVAEAAGRLGVSRRSASRHLQALWKAGIVSRVAPEDDGRRREFRLTDQGAALVQAGMLVE